jgi:hypothetical protein
VGKLWKKNEIPPLAQSQEGCRAPQQYPCGAVNCFGSGQATLNLVSIQHVKESIEKCLNGYLRVTWYSQIIAACDMRYAWIPCEICLALRHVCGMWSVSRRLAEVHGLVGYAWYEAKRSGGASERRRFDT